MGDDGAILLRHCRQHVVDFLARGSAELDRVLTELDDRRLDETERLEELLHRRDAAGRRSLHRINPAVGLVPAGDRAAFDQGRRLLRSVAGLLGELSGTEGAGENPVGKRPGSDTQLDEDAVVAAVGADVDLRSLRLRKRVQRPAHDADGERHPIGEAKHLANGRGPLAERQPRDLVAVDVAVKQPLAVVVQRELKAFVLADLHLSEIDFPRLEAQLRRGQLDG